MIFHPDLQWKRAITHIPHGLLVGLLCWNPGWAGKIMAGIYAYWFIKYEENEDKYTKDQAWNDELGAIIGLFIVACLYLIWGRL